MGNDSELFEEPDFSDEDDTDGKELDLTSKKDLLPTEESSDSIYQILAKTSKRTAERFLALKARMSAYDDENSDTVQDSEQDKGTISRSFFSNPFSSLTSFRKRTIQDEIRDRNEIRAKKNIPEIDEAKAV